MCWHEEVYVFTGRFAPALETKLHHHFVLKQINKVNYRKEFFRVSIPEIRGELEALGLAATWTMVAAAKNYCQTLAIEKVIANDPIACEAWLKRQLLPDPGSEEIGAEVEPA